MSEISIQQVHALACLLLIDLQFPSMNFCAKCAQQSRSVGNHAAL
jgi:hypothetical protein